MTITFLILNRDCLFSFQPRADQGTSTNKCSCKRITRTAVFFNHLWLINPVQQDSVHCNNLYENLTHANDCKYENNNVFVMNRSCTAHK